jgi:DNA repair protein RecN (Recombination protein N)
MILELHIKNLALIEDVHIEFSPGFSVFTGETGAGKSILIEAIGLVLGDRASTEQIRSGFEEAEITSVFELDNIQKSLKEILEINGINIQDKTLIIRRIISKSGKNKIYINQIPIPLNVLKLIGDNLVDFHGQHEHQWLLEPKSAQKTIDRLSGVEEIASEYAKKYADYISAKNALEQFDQKCAELASKKEFLEFQYNEIASLNLKPNEEESLEKEISMIASSAQRIECISKINEIMLSEETSLSRMTNTIKKNLEILSKYDSSAIPWAQEIENCLNIFSELERFCADYLEKEANGFSQEYLDSLNNRIAKIQRLKKKYNCDYKGLLEKLENLKHDLETLQNVETDRSELAKKEKLAYEECINVGKKLSLARKKHAQIFDKAITQCMSKLGFKDGMWKTEFSQREYPQEDGFEDIIFTVRTNPGEPALPLAKIASGGEISRLMLAIKTVLAKNDYIPILIFDEIDTGIGGMIAKEVADALVSLSKMHQVLCISHLPQIASKADNHYKVYKDTNEGRTITKVKKLTNNERINELARMLGGESTIAKKHAEELLK